MHKLSPKCRSFGDNPATVKHVTRFFPELLPFIQNKTYENCILHTSKRVMYEIKQPLQGRDFGIFQPEKNFYSPQRRKWPGHHAGPVPGYKKDIATGCPAAMKTGISIPVGFLPHSDGGRPLNEELVMVKKRAREIPSTQRIGWWISIEELVNRHPGIGEPRRRASWNTWTSNWGSGKIPQKWICRSLRFTNTGG